MTITLSFTAELEDGVGHPLSCEAVHYDLEEMSNISFQEQVENAVKEQQDYWTEVFNQCSSISLRSKMHWQFRDDETETILGRCEFYIMEDFLITHYEELGETVFEAVEDEQLIFETQDNMEQYLGENYTKFMREGA